jgi:hypothetical protein
MQPIPDLPEIDISQTEYLRLNSDLLNIINEYNTMVAQIESRQRSLAEGLRFLRGFLDDMEGEFEKDLPDAPTHAVRHPGMGDELNELRGFIQRARVAITAAGG